MIMGEAAREFDYRCKQGGSARLWAEIRDGALAVAMTQGVFQ